MGYMRHHAIIVSTFSEKDVKLAHAKAAELGCDPQPIHYTGWNSIHTFMIPPDGSKEGWDESDAGDVRRADFLRWITTLRFEDGSTVFDWCEVQYGDENGDNRMLRHDDDAVAYWDWAQSGAAVEIEPNTRAWEVLRCP